MKTYRIFSLVCYEDSEDLDYNKIYNKLTKLKYIYFIIKHDQDQNTKLHYHIAIYSKSPTTIPIIAKKLDIRENYIKIQDELGSRYTLKKTIGYLIHYNNKDKINYNIENIISNDNELVRKYYDIISNDKGEASSLREIMLFITNNQPNCKDLINFCIDNDLLKVFRKYSYFLNQIIKENIYENQL